MLWGSDYGFDKLPEVEMCGWVQGRAGHVIPLQMYPRPFRNYGNLFKLRASFDLLCSMLMLVQLKQI